MKKSNPSHQHNINGSASRQSGAGCSSPSRRTINPIAAIELYREVMTECKAQFQYLTVMAEFPCMGELFPRRARNGNGVEYWSPLDSIVHALWDAVRILTPGIDAITKPAVIMNRLQRPPSAREWDVLKSVHNELRNALSVIDKIVQQCQSAWDGQNPAKADQIPALAFSYAEKRRLKKQALGEVAYAVMAVVVGGVPTAEVASYLRMPLPLFTKLVSRFSCSGIQGLAAVWPEAKRLRNISPFMWFHRHWREAVLQSGIA